MRARPRSWWQQTKTHPVASVLIALVIALVVLVLIGGYKLNWAWTGFTGADKSDKTLYDWLQLLFVPLALAGLGFWLNSRERKAEERHADKERMEAERRADYEQKAAERRAEVEREIEQKHAETEREISLDNQHEKALQAYIDNMSALLLEKDLRDQVQLDKVRKIARVRTLTVLPRCDGRRKAIVLNFLYEYGLIDKDQKIVDLDGADLSEAYLFRAQLHMAGLSRANLCKANLIEANLLEADLSSAILIEAKLRSAWLLEAYLRGADLSKADLTGAKVTPEQLAEVSSLKGATMPNGTKHD